MRLDDVPQSVLTLDTIQQDDTLIVYMIGECDISTVPRLMEELSRAVQENKNVVLDVHLLTFIDSTGVAAISSAYQTLSERGFQLRIAGSHGVFSKVARLAQLNDQVQFYETVEDAKAGRNPRPPS